MTLADEMLAMLDGDRERRSFRAMTDLRQTHLSNPEWSSNDER